ncbi:MAG: hypothetical protein JO105_15015 [Hyphomicrobiales bacterium]|nr:hypothetical protein [Hyphomicrobiales bacterium]
MAGAEIQACNVTVDVIDTDPKGTNLRDAPGGKVMAVLKLPADNVDDWIEVHVVGQSGDWFLIDAATLVGDGEKSIFKGSGYAHRSVLGSSGLQSHTTILSDHQVKSPVIASNPSGDQPIGFLGCWGDFVKIHTKEGTGWTKGLCLNQRTTCS